MSEVYFDDGYFGAFLYIINRRLADSAVMQRVNKRGVKSRRIVITILGYTACPHLSR